MYDVSIIGNGILGTTLAIELTKIDPQLKILLIGPKDRFGSASVASGAMINVFAEIENKFLENDFLKKRFELDLKALKLWKNHHKSLEAESNEKIEIGWGTYILNTSRGTKYEDRLFEYLENMLGSIPYKQFTNESTNPDNIEGLCAQAAHRAIRALKIEDGIINSQQLLKSIDKIIRNKTNITYLFEIAKEIDSKNGEIKVTTEKNIYKAEKVVLANGSYSQKLVDKLDELKKNTPRLFFGAGSAVILKDNNNRKKFAKANLDNKPKFAIRTMDRGHACGLHILPFKTHMYLGASSAVYSEPEPNPRANQIAFLLNDGMNQIGPVVGRAIFDKYTYGFRPVSEDIFPLIGESCIKGIWYLNGTKRSGLTMSPYVCSELAKQILFGKSDLPSEFNPSRKLISYFNKDIAIEKAVIGMYNKENTHNMTLSDSNNFKEYFSRLKKDIEEVYEEFNLKNFGIHPELIGNYKNGLVNKNLLFDK